MTESKFMQVLEEKLRNKMNKHGEKALNDASISKYMEILLKMNNGNKFTSLGFLRDKRIVDAKLSDKSDATKKTALSVIVSILKLLDVKAYKPVLTQYFDEMQKLASEKKAFDSKNEKTEKQTKNWLDWPQLVNIYNERTDEVKSLFNKRRLDESEFNKLQDWFVMGLYMLTPPRRNKDYQLMYILDNPPNNSTEINYLDMHNKRFIFNNHKTNKMKAFEHQEVSIPADLLTVIKTYLKHYPVDIKKNVPVPLLVDFKNKNLNQVNDITRVLNRAFGSKRKISSTMLRHIYDSFKYGDVLKEMKKDAIDMAHSLSMQKDYIKL